MDQGVVSASIVPFGSQTIPRAVFNVPRFTINNFAYLFRPTTRERNRIFELKKALSRGNPVILELGTAADFTQLKAPYYQITSPPTETHVLTVVGYDENEKYFELRSSLGRHWADAGYVRISYDDLARYADNGFVIIPN
jgi:C1A family cysteine protease